MSDVGGPGGPPDSVDGDRPTELRQYKSVRFVLVLSDGNRFFRTLPRELVQPIRQPNFEGVLELGVVIQLYPEIKLKVRFKYRYNSLKCIFRQSRVESQTFRGKEKI